MRGKGKGQRFDYLFRRFDRISRAIVLSISDMCISDYLKELKRLQEEVEAKEVYSDYERHDKYNLLQQISWYFRLYRFYEREI